MSDGVVTIPFYVHESEVCRQERTIKRLWLTSLALVAAVVAVCAGWVWRELNR